MIVDRMIVDAHHHLWRIDRGDYAWLTSDLPIHRDYGLDDLLPLLGDITATVLVQAAPTEAETAFMLEQARLSDGLVRAVVGWTDLLAPDAPDRIAAMAQDPLLRGLRPMLQDIDDSVWILQPDLAPALDAMSASGLRLDLLVTPRHLPHLAALAQLHPDLPAVIDHGAKPDIAHDDFTGWAAGIARLARETAWCCKLSGLVTEAGPDWQPDTLRRYVEHLLACFGPERLMWGSDWPVVDLAGGFARWREASLALIPGSARAEILGGTAARFYGIA